VLLGLGIGCLSQGYNYVAKCGMLRVRMEYWGTK